MATVFYLSSMPFDFLVQRPQELCLQLADQGFHCCYIYRYPLRNIVKSSYKKDLSVMKRIPSNIDIESVVMLPRRLSGLGGDMLLKQAEGKLVKKKIASLVHKYDAPRIAIVSDWGWAPYVSRNWFDLVIYDFIDDLEVFQFANDSQRRLAYEYHDLLLKESDCVLVTANPKLRSEAEAQGARHILTVGNGVNSRYFQQQAQSPAGQTMTREFKTRAGRPIVGYLGAIYEWFDLPLVLESARQCPDAQFLLAGPISPTVSAMISTRSVPDNIIFTGQIAKDHVPALLAAFDLALIPFRPGVIAEGTDPIKLYEYFMWGKPVVSTQMPALKSYEKLGLLKMADSPAQFAEYIKGYLSDPGDESAVQMRQEIAFSNDWSHKAQIITDYINQRLG
ncbi:MAG: glycosyltransferase [Candidatus Saccharibacteria bacterium]